MRNLQFPFLASELNVNKNTRVEFNVGCFEWKGKREIVEMKNCLLSAG